MSFELKQGALLRIGHRPRAWSVSFQTSMTAGVREDAAIGLVAGVSQDGTAVRNDFDRIPIFQRPIFNATWDRASQSWIRLVPQGAPDFTWSPTEPYREVVYRCQPFWYQLDMGVNDAPRRISVTDRPMTGYTLAPMFKNGGDFVYRPCFEMGLGADGLPHTRAGLAPYRANAVALMEAARAYDATARTECVADWTSDLLLLLVEMATWDLGGVMSGSTGTAVVDSGAALPYLAASSGSLGSGLPCVWRGKENPWKGINSLLCDLAVRKVAGAAGNALELWWLSDVSKFDGTLNAHYRMVDGYLTNETGVVDYRGLRMSADGFLYPALRGSVGVSIKGVSYVYADFISDRPIMLAVGGGSTTAMLSTAIKGSHLNVEAVDLSNWRAEHFGARLVAGGGGTA